jgi:putative ABC transport system permease protein
MFRNLFTASLRNLTQNATYTTLHVAGLTLGITCALFIGLYVIDELSYDRFHEKKDRIHRIVTTILQEGNETYYPSTQVPMATELTAKYTDVENTVRLQQANRDVFENPERDVKFYEAEFYYTDPAFFDVFSFQLLSGDAENALKEPHTALVTPAIAEKYFGTQDVIGKVLKLRDENFKVTGIIGAPPHNSSIRFDALLSYSTLPPSEAWDNWYPDTYVLIAEGRSTTDVDRALASILKERVDPIFENSGFTVSYWLQPITEQHLSALNRESTGANYVYIFAAIGVFVVLIACINYINLATARAAKRAKEIGIRKTVGSGKMQIMVQFITESMVVAGTALFLSIILTTAMIPFFNDLSGKSIDLFYLIQPEMIVAALVLTVTIGFLGGSYPAVYLSQFRPVLVLKGNISRGAGNSRLRKTLVTLQFAISISALICTWVVYDQLQFLQDKELGFSKDQVLNIELDDDARKNYPILYNKLKEYSNVVEVSSSSSVPGKGYNYNAMKVDSPDGLVAQGVFNYFVDYDYAQTMGFHIVRGRNFSRNFTTDSTAALVNESMVKAMQWDEPIGKRFVQDDGNVATTDRAYVIVGVIKDWHQESLHSPIIPLAIFLGEPSFWLNVKIHPADVSQTLAVIKSNWTEVNSGKPFSYEFLDDSFDSQYKDDEKRGQIFALFSGICMVISCVGLFGLAAYSTEVRAKEIGIRKVVGASIPVIVGLFYKDFLKLIFFGLLLSFPLSYLVMDNWLQTFAYQTSISWAAFVLSAVITLAITMSAISFHTLKAATANPAITLRSE